MGNLFSGFLIYVALPLFLLAGGLAVVVVGAFLIGGGLRRRPAGVAPAGASSAPAAWRNPSLLLGGAATALVGVLLMVPGVVCGVVGVDAYRKDQAIKGGKADARQDLQRLLAAQRAYRRANGGFYDRPSCLARPASCIPGYSGAPFLDEDVAALPARSGNTFSFHPGTAAPRGGHVSPSSLDGYAFVANGGGEDPGLAYTLCVDARGLVCYVSRQDAGEGGACACWAPGASGGAQVIEFVHRPGTSSCPQLVGQLEVYNELEREIVTDVRAAGSAPLSFGPNLTLARRQGAAIDVFFTCAGGESFTAEVMGLKPEDTRANPDTLPTYPSDVTVRGTIAR